MYPAQYSILSGALTVFRSLLAQPAYAALRDTLATLEGADPVDFCSAYGALTAQILRDGPLGDSLRNALWQDENPLIDCLRTRVAPSAYLTRAVDYDLSVLTRLSALSGQELKALAQTRFSNAAASVALLPDYPVSPLALPDCSALLWLYKTQGYGYFTQSTAFALENGELRPIPAPSVTLADLKGYAWQKDAILENTRSFLRGETANNILLYGDKGCGKSSTVKAVAAALAGEGLKIIAFPAKEVPSFRKIHDLLAQSPFRFILFMDDLTFEDETGEYMALKAFMEGGMAEKTPNALIYATSNRRHLIREKFSDRDGDDVNVRETIDTQTSLSDRFGLLLPFSVPSKQEYLEIVDALAAEQGVTLPAADLHRRAEAFALQKSGRSPRTARQFLNTLKAHA